MMVSFVVGLFLLVFFKQRTAYEMRISDWSSDVCSSDLLDSIEKGATAIINGDDPPTRRRRTGDAGGDAQSPLPAQLCRLPLFLACAFHRGETRKPEIAEVGKAERDRKSKSLNSSQ